MAEPRIRRIPTQREFDSAIDDYITQGYEVINRGESSVMLRKKTWGTGTAHAVLALFTSWWTLFLGNVAYALYAHSAADKVLVRLESGAQVSSVMEPAAAPVGPAIEAPPE